MIDITTEKEHVLDTQNRLIGEVGIAVIHGAVKTAGQIIKTGYMLVSKLGNTCPIVLEPQTHILLFGGLPFPEERFIYWNFVGSDKSILEKAKERWRQDKFPKVPGDHTYVILP